MSSDLNVGMSERIGFLEGKTGTASSTPLVTTYVKPKTRRVLLVALLGDMAAETIDVAIFKASDSSGTGAASLKAATQLAAHATNNDNKRIVIETWMDEWDEAKPFLGGRCVTGGATGGVVALVLLGEFDRAQRVEDFDHADVVEIKR